MKLTQKTRYGVRALFDLAYFGRGGAVLAKEVAARQQIPLRYLEQLLGELRRAGLVSAKRGPGGGYTLARPPDRVRLSDVVRALQGPIDALFAVEGEPHDVHASLWRDLAKQVASCFDAVTLKELCERRDRQRTMYFI